MHVQIERFGGSNWQKYEILTPITPKKHEKPKISGTETSKWYYTLFRPLAPPIFFRFWKQILWAFFWTMSQSSTAMHIFLIGTFARVVKIDNFSEQLWNMTPTHFFSRYEYKYGLWFVFSHICGLKTGKLAAL